MSGSADSTRARIISAAYELFYSKGFARVSVDMISARAEVTKPTLYYYFESKDALAATALDVRHRRVLAILEEWGLHRAASAENLVDILFTELFSWASQEGWAGSGFTRLTFEFLDFPGHPARQAASRHKAEVEDYLTARLRDIGEPRAPTLARSLVVLLEGGISLALVHGNIGYIQDARSAALDLVHAGRSRDPV
ncbi:MAG: TetR/AcrR family transcriptional regulator [Inquilinaceae bacterium]